MSNESEDSEMPADVCIDSTTPPNVALCAKYKRSFGYITVKDRLPVILTQVVDHLSRDKEQIVKECGEEEAREELKIVIGRISKLKNEVQTNKPLEPIQTEGPDVSTWNNLLEQLKGENSEPCWFQSPWLIVECYMYRRMHEAFEMTKSLSTYDPFRDKKQEALQSSSSAINLLAEYVCKLLQTKVCSELKNEFLKLFYVDLWGNRCDLSLSTGGQVVIEEDPLEKLNLLSDFILTNDIEKIWNTLQISSRNPDTIIDIIMDNAGYELFTDLCLADFIVTFSLAKQVRLRVKSIPWYVSDTLVPDFHWTLQTLAKSNNPSVSTLAGRWSGYLESGTWTLHADAFWTLPHVYSQMQTVDPTLYQDLSKAALLIFKGDLNYRKLTGDINWEPTKLFSEALSGFQPSNIAALRTLKADTICGLLPGQAEETAAKSTEWLISGQYAVIQFSAL